MRQVLKTLKTLALVLGIFENRRVIYRVLLAVFEGMERQLIGVKNMFQLPKADESRTNIRKQTNEMELWMKPKSCTNSRKKKIST